MSSEELLYTNKYISTKLPKVDINNRNRKKERSSEQFMKNIMEFLRFDRTIRI